MRVVLSGGSVNNHIPVIEGESTRSMVNGAKERTENRQRASVET